ncbi:hypothetical protein ASPWEDRAFT_697324 [Aspergillus wentii DTO 134E9]|uniref:Uncharacterized protein n=1 Tax=Aspergillus wentii DTO 134E9 TaxID=1073089 RepID=A0A1L9R9I0_ASPWE|nr:uncharacterized protein ASPWEDRAFT_697324 [Aspergillus wentii DTO 134E9]KAI9926380.1 hypothetical protein MW887_004144 [Aspergillus wentii]OJJ31585.1 hypothetical protein ASPWEDRAFT_697324 [Aspergillus wentii DTO 134E9]
MSTTSTLSTATTTGTASTATSSCSAKLYDIPTHDAACAMPMRNNNSAIMSSCCGEASVVSYDDCDYYCLARGQNVGDLATCLIKASEAGEVWCNTNANATASASVTVGTIVATGSSASSTGDSTEASATSSSAAGRIQAPMTLSKSAAGVLAMLVLGSTAQLVL